MAKMEMVKKDGKMVPSFAADGKGKMMKGGKTPKKGYGGKTMKNGGTKKK
jgi:hypothetical protein